MDSAFKYVHDKGTELESDYPYIAKRQTCQEASHPIQFKITGFTDVTPGSVDALKNAVGQQPVSVAIQANQLAFQSYKSGVLNGNCGTNLDHGVLAVGYGTDAKAGDYWKVKNSWGPTWGE